MALEGELKDFNILEVIQLLGQQGKTGVLRVWGLGKKDDEAGIFFFDGKITHATSTGRTKGGLLGERLAKTGIISRDNLQTALRTQKKSRRFLGEIVVEAGMAEEQTVLNALHTQVHELVYEVFRLEAGKFKFDALTGEAFPKISLQLHADEVMLNILKMVDEWPEIEKKAPSPTMVLQKAGTLEKHGIDLSEAHASVYRLVDGTRSVQEIIDMSLVGKFATLEILASLLEGGDIKELGIKRGALPAQAAPRVEVRRQRPAYARYGLGLLISFILLLVSLFPFKLAFLWTDHRGEGYSLRGYAERMRQERVEWGRKIFFLERGRYPESRRELVDAGILTEKDLKGVDVRRESNHP
ncbi:MAG: hypothetical protein A2Z08_07370 [Deltaproteobacteria bacterium RBG_16_54_11]|nr:MAG: hypothetical protein A2Z08_07370 [Deltaproteobacteria bacterium RBG_16_54_11]